MMMFALIWSVGASADYNSRNRFNQNFRMVLSKKGIPLLDNYYDYYFNL